jgi:hypothetical protein
MLQEQLTKVKNAISDPEFQTKVIQGVVKAVIITAAIGVTSAAIKHSDTAITNWFEANKDKFAVNPAPDLQQG